MEVKYSIIKYAFFVFVYKCSGQLQNIFQEECFSTWLLLLIPTISLHFCSIQHY